MKWFKKMIEAFTINEISGLILKKQRDKANKLDYDINYSKPTIFKPREKEEKFLIKQGEFNGRR